LVNSKHYFPSQHVVRWDFFMSSEKKHIRYLRKREKTGQKCHAFSRDEVMVIIKIGQFIDFLRKKGGVGSSRAPLFT